MERGEENERTVDLRFVSWITVAMELSTLNMDALLYSSLLYPTAAPMGLINSATGTLTSGILRKFFEVIEAV